MVSDTPAPTGDTDTFSRTGTCPREVFFWGGGAEGDGGGGEACGSAAGPGARAGASASGLVALRQLRERSRRTGPRAEGRGRAREPGWRRRWRGGPAVARRVPEGRQSSCRSDGFSD